MFYWLQCCFFSLTFFCFSFYLLIKIVMPYVFECWDLFNVSSLGDRIGALTFSSLILVIEPTKALCLPQAIRRLAADWLACTCMYVCMFLSRKECGFWASLTPSLRPALTLWSSCPYFANTEVRGIGKVCPVLCLTPPTHSIPGNELRAFVLSHTSPSFLNILSQDRTEVPDWAWTCSPPASQDARIIGISHHVQNFLNSQNLRSRDSRDLDPSVLCFQCFKHV